MGIELQFKFQQSSSKEFAQQLTPFSMTADETTCFKTNLTVETATEDDIKDAIIEPLRTCVTETADLDWVVPIYMNSDSGYTRIARLELNKGGFGMALDTKVDNEVRTALEELSKILVDFIPDVIISAMSAMAASSPDSEFSLKTMPTSEGSGDAIESLIAHISSKTKAEIVKPTETLDSYVCDESLKEELLEVKDFFENAKVYKDLGVSLPKGILFKGPPGTGKTYAARCIAGGVDCYFMTCTASALQGMYIGSGAENIRDVFKGAKTLREKSGKGVIIFIDELDSLGSRDTHNGNAGGEEDRTLNQLLAEMSGFEDCDGIMILAATNYPERLDDALMRSGRFSRQISINIPEKEERRALVEFYFKKVKLPLEDTDYENITELTDGMTPADIKEVCNESAILAIRAKSSKLKLEHVNEAINRTITKNVRRPDTLDQRLVAAHESGHVLAEVLFNGTVPIKVTNYSYGDAGGFTQTSLKLTGIIPQEKFLNQVKILLAGRAAEEAIVGYITNGASNDLSRAIRIMNAYYNDYLFAAYDVSTVKQKVLDDISKYYQEVLEVFKKPENFNMLTALTDRLVAERVLYASDIIAVTSLKGETDFL